MGSGGSRGDDPDLDDDQIGDLDDDAPHPEPGHRTPSMRPASSRQLELAGTLLEGSYKLIEFLASGGMGEVWLARHVGLAKELVVKLVRDDLARDRNYVRALFREAKVTAQLQAESDHIVPVLHVGEDQGYAFYVMELLRGEPLDRYLSEQGGKLSVAEGKRLLSQILDGLRVAHSRGVVHRDIKPSNIVVEQKGNQVRARILDFGIANARDFVTTTHTALPHDDQAGTIRYMAPEQLTGAAPAAAPALDVFAVGLLAYEIFSGRHPFDGLLPPQLSVRYAAGAEPERLDQLLDEGRPLVAADVADVVARALSFDPATRFQDAGQMLAALEQTDEVRPWDLPAGTTIKNRYVIKRLLGSGGMGAVYEVQDRQRDRRAALKIVAVRTAIPEELTTQLHARFDAECDVLLHQIRHPHVVRLFDKDRFQGHPYCVMEFVDGLPLHDLGPHIWKRPDGWLQILALLRQIAEALDAVHAAGVIHRDVKPDNIVLSGGEGTLHATLIDFGIAKTAGLDLTNAEARLGTPGFAAPEQLRAAAPGQPPRPVPATDQFGLAATVYYMLTGRRPGQRADDAGDHIVDQRVLAGDVEDVVGLRPAGEIPAGVGAVVMRALSVDPDDRFATTVAFVEALAHASGPYDVLAAGPPTLRAGASATPPVRSWPRTIALGVAAAAVAGVAVFALARTQRSDAPAAAVAADPGPVAAATEASPPPKLDAALAGVDAPPSIAPTVQVQVVARRRGAARDGIELVVDGAQVRTPTTVERQPGQTLLLEVVDGRYQPTRQQCAIAHDTTVCAIDLQRRSRKGKRTDNAADDDASPSKRKRLLHEFGDGDEKAAP